MMSSEIETRRFADRASLAVSIAAEIAARLEEALRRRGIASLVVSGGRTPAPLFEALRRQPLEWSRVCVALADERWVEPTDAASNEHLVRETLLKERAAAARFIGLKNAAPSPDVGAVAAWETFARIPRPFDTTLLGMGDDGHTASLFPGSPNLARALDASAQAGCVGMWAPTAPQPRMSLNLSALLDSRYIALLIAGEDKWRTLEQARGAGPTEAMPVRALLRQRRVPVEILWAP